MTAKRRGPALVAAAAIAVALAAGGLVVARRHASVSSDPSAAGAGAVATEPATALRGQGRAAATSTFKSWVEFARFAPGSDDREAPAQTKAMPAKSVPVVQEEKSTPAGSARPETDPRELGKRAARGSGVLIGAWEGRWTDPEKQQKGRLSLQIAVDGAVAGWMFTSAAQKSYRLAGRMTSGGALDLACQCPPGQGFVARGTIRSGSESELKGLLSLSTAAGVFGQSHLTLRRTTAK